MKIKDYFRLAIDGKWLTRIFTVLLSGIAFALFALSALAFTNRPIDIIGRAVRSYEKDYFIVYDFTDSVLPLSKNGVLGLFEEIDGLQNEYLYGYEGRKSSKGGVVSFYPYFASYAAMGEGDYFGFHPQTLCGNFENWSDFFTVLAGRYPENRAEVAISECQYEYFRQYGYRDMSAAFYYDEEEGDYRVDESKAGESFEINGYADIIGKQVHVSDESLTAVTIVGVIGNKEGVAHPNASESSLLQNFVFLHEEWNDVMREKCAYLYFQKPTDAKTIRAIAEAALAADDIARAKDPFAEENIGTNYLIGVVSLNSACSTYRWAESMAKLIGAVAVLLGVFGFILNVFLMRSAIKRKEKKIGILRAMGASDKLVRKIFLSEALCMAVLIFLFALLVLILGYAVIFRSIFYVEMVRDGLSYATFVLNLFNFLILAACCFGIPLLAALIPIKRFFKKPIVSNIRGN